MFAWLKKNWPTWGLGLIILSGSLNLFVKFYQPSAYLQGWLVDYWLPKIYLVDLVILLFLGLFLAEKIYHHTFSLASWRSFNRSLTCTQKIWASGLVIFSLILIIRQFFTPLPGAAFYQLAKLAEFVSLGLAIYHLRSRLNWRILSYFFSGLIIGQTLLVLYQFFAQQALLPYHWLGETDLSIFYGLPRFTIAGRELVVPHGTFAHPNILAGCLVISWLSQFFFNDSNDKKSSLLLTISLSCLILVLLLTQSWSAWLTLLTGLIIFFLSKKTQWGTKVFRRPWLFLCCLIIIPLIIGYLSYYQPVNDSLTRRHHLNQVASQVWLAQPGLGNGLNQFITQLPTYPDLAPPNFLQPVHHLGLLWLAETGLIGLGLIICLIGALSPATRAQLWLKLFILWPLITLDHYLLTLTPGLLFLTLWLSLEKTAPLETGVAVDNSLKQHQK